MLAAVLLSGGIGPASGGQSEALSAFAAELRSMPKLTTGRQAEQVRHALVVGIDDYEELTDLNKAVGDSSTIAETLTALGFKVTRLENLGIDAFDEALDEFYQQLAPGDIAFLFFAGHGVALDGSNYLLPADMPELRAIKASRLGRRAIDAEGIVDAIKARDVELAFVVLDACRNNPFQEDGQRGAVPLGGLTRMMPKEGAFIIYSAGVGQTALDRLGDDDPEPNSVFTRKFWQILSTPGLPVVEIAKRTQVEVAALAATVHHEQAPAYYDEIVGQFYFQPPQPKLYGLVIGIGDYGEPRARLPSAENDLALIAETLKRAGAQRVERLENDDARPRFIEYVWRDLLDEARAGDTIALTFSGHAASEPDRTGTESDGRMEFLLLAGRKGFKDFYTTDKGGDPERKLTDVQLTKWMADAAEKNVNVLLLIDGTYAGGMLNREFANVSFIGAAPENEDTIDREIDGVKHGVASLAFANALAGAADLNSDGFITQRELYAYVDENIYRLKGRGGRPQLFPTTADSASGLALVQVPKGGADGIVDLSRYWSR
jgi:uncharacterized caspase-like protein